MSPFFQSSSEFHSQRPKKERSRGALYNHLRSFFIQNWLFFTSNLESPSHKRLDFIDIVLEPRCKFGRYNAIGFFLRLTSNHPAISAWTSPIERPVALAMSLSGMLMAMRFRAIDDAISALPSSRPSFLPSSRPSFLPSSRPSFLPSSRPSFLKCTPCQGHFFG